MPYGGQSLKQCEDHRLLTGQGQCLDAMTFPGLRHAVVLRRPHAPAVLTSLAVTAARQAPGVVAVVAAADLEHVAAPLPTRRHADADALRPPAPPLTRGGF